MHLNDKLSEVSQKLIHSTLHIVLKESETEIAQLYLTLSNPMAVAH